MNMDEERGRESAAPTGDNKLELGCEVCADTGGGMDEPGEFGEEWREALNTDESEGDCETQQQTDTHEDARGAQTRAPPSKNSMSAAGAVDGSGETESEPDRKQGLNGGDSSAEQHADMKETATATRNTMEGRLERQSTEDIVDLPAHVLHRLRGMHVTDVSKYNVSRARVSRMSNTVDRGLVSLKDTRLVTTLKDINACVDLSGVVTQLSRQRDLTKRITMVNTGMADCGASASKSAAKRQLHRYGEL
ncbi:hypothetical protein WMY93_002405 [Mugilogobius chulae]|uniref:F-box domain-containing protein n=1 Tax=Mugilogobius chulae TaxID=88201 RepID=A0AAW0PWM8_9GOBI